MKRQMIIALLLALMLLVAGCSAGRSSEMAMTEAVNKSVPEMFTDRDMQTDYDEESSTRIELSGSSAVCDSDAVQISGSVITITDEGTYIISGTLEDGMLVVDAGDDDKVWLVLDGAEIISQTSAALYIREADKVFLTTAPGSENVLSNGGTYESEDEDNMDAVIFSRSDLTLNGDGTLTVNAAAGHGIVSKDDLKLTGGIYIISAEGHGFSGKDSVRIADGTYTIIAGKDGIHAENGDEDELGFIYTAGGTFDITADGDGMSAGSYLLAEGGEYTIKAGGGSENASEKNGAGDFKEFGERGMPDQEDEDDTESASAKGIKASSDLTINGGSFVLDTADDAFHSDGDLTINGGMFEITAGDDGIHADAAAVINGGVINIAQSYEGIEGLSIDIAGGTITLTASDDGLNAAGGNDGSGTGGGDMFAATEGAYIKISGGSLYVNASGDGIDSNGDLFVTGGETYVSGSVNSGNGALDYNGEASVSGGIFIATGSSGMAQNFGDTSTQGVMLVNVNSASAGSTILLSDADGNELLSWQPDKEYTSVVISCPEITEGSAYILTTGGDTTEITMDSLVYGLGGMGSGMGGGHGGRGGGPGGGRPGGRGGGPGGMTGEAGNVPDGEESWDAMENGRPSGMGGAPGGMNGTKPGDEQDGNSDAANDKTDSE